ncbi:hypothetical protein [Streptomyces cylindrosporus]|uniref:Uncharacterized protein n=1 Tax=Streptomyces cylindrosporus TaxID=2927583 RepID=A0ABS9YKA9_9ACTN|nr:hypothetical protein [Streptomyces cylindrosporus]MCI3277653.1 hypothetical protein [Streptomyces cylindrosporus]
MAINPYVTAPEFEAHPTYLDLGDLRSGIADPDAQTAELENVLLMASSWADGECNQPLAAHQLTLATRGRCDAQGVLHVYPTDRPVRSVSKVAFGETVGAQTTLTSPAYRVEQNQTILISIGAGAARPGAWLYVDLTYIAGWVTTTLTAGATAGSTSLTVADPTGILPGHRYRLWEPGVEEVVTVSEAYAPAAVTVPPTATAIPLAAPTTSDHTPGGGWSGMPSDMRLAVVNYGVSQLMRPDTAAEDSYPDTPLASGTRQKDPRRDGSGLVAEAVRLLHPFARRM